MGGMEGILKRGSLLSLITLVSMTGTTHPGHSMLIWGATEKQELSEPCCPMLRLAQDVIVPSPVPPISLLLVAFGGHSSGEEPIKTCLPELPQKPCTCKYRTPFMSCWRVE